MNILCLDGGGSKGVYTLGILKELEAMLGKPIHETFQYVYGTSTGSIIAALIGLGYSITDIERLYLELIPKIMAKKLPSGRSKALKKELDRIFEDNNFSDFAPGIAVGIIATNIDEEKPFIFKSSSDQAYKMQASFIPGFGATIADAVLASCAAYPLFNKASVKTMNQHTVRAIDGGFIGNNPILFAIADVTNALGKKLHEVNFVSLGTGNFVEKSPSRIMKVVKWLWSARLMEKILKSNANTTDLLARLLHKDIRMVRINESFNQPQYGTSMLENNKEKLELLNRLGRTSFANNEDKLRAMLMPAPSTATYPTKTD